MENASLMPWLVGTAFLHSIMVQEKRGMLKIWNVSLIIATFVLALLGTFLVRSGILESIHAFGASTIGVQFLVFIAIVVIGSAALVIWRLPDLRSEARLDSLLSREAFFLLNNLVLVALCLVVFWGTFFPLISEAVTGTESSVGPPWFNRVVTPLALALVALMTIGPMVAWRRDHAGGAAAGGGGAAGVRGGGRRLVLALVTNAADSLPSLLMFCLSALVLGVVVQEFVRGASARRVMAKESWPRALSQLVGRNRRRYGGYVVHVGIAVLFLGVAGSSAFQQQRDVRLAPGDSFRTGDYEVTYVRPTAKLGGDSAGTGAPISFGAVLDVRKGDERFVLAPSRNYYPTRDASRGAIGRFFEGEATSEVDVRWGLRRDFWAAVRPDIGALDGPIREANAKFGNSNGDVQALIIAAIADRYAQRSRPDGHVPHDRVAAGRLDLDRRRDRSPGRADRRVAVAGGAAAARALARGGAAGPRALPGLGSPGGVRAAALVLACAVALVVIRPLIRGDEPIPAEEARRRRARGRQGGEVPRDP